MAPTPHVRPARNGVERIREELLTALHLGKLAPGDRAPSVRRLADRIGLNRKTVHRAYIRLAREGLLDLRPGSGTFISELGGRAEDAGTLDGLLLAANRCKAAAETLGLSPARLAAFLELFHGRGLRGLRLAVAECNEEQLGLIALELRAGLGTQVRPLLLSELAGRPHASLDGVVGLVTTDCHRSEVEVLASPTALPVYRLALDAAFPQRLVDEARRGYRVLMVVRDRRFAPVFVRLLERLSGSHEPVGRFTIVEPGPARRLLRQAGTDTAVYVSPLVERSMPPLPVHVRRIRTRWRLEHGSLDRLRAALAYDLAVRDSRL